MKTQNETKTEMGYYNQSGIVGQYKGKDVCVLDKDDMKPELAQDNSVIYAVRESQVRGTMTLVLSGWIIGSMTDGGRVDIYDSDARRKYPFPKPAPAPVARPEKTEPPPVLPQELNVEFGYGEYSKVVDDFFKGLDKLWAELEVG